VLKLIRFLVTIFINTFYKVEIIGIENVPEKGPAILCANHKGILDMFFIGYRLKRLVRYMAKQELFKNFFLSLIIRYLGAFPVKRGVGDVKAVKTALDLLKKGHIVGIFPEGTRTRGKRPGEIKVKPGSALLTIKSGVPIIPVAIEGTYKPFSRVKVIFGRPFSLDVDKNKKYTVKEMTTISQDIMKRVYSLMEAN